MRRLAAAACGLALVAGCGNFVGNTTPAGLLGVMVDRDGHRIAVGYICHGSVDVLSIVRDRTGLSDDQDNPAIATYTSSAPQKGLVRIDLDDPAEGWSRSTEPDLRPGAGYLLTMEGSGDDDSETSTVWITGDQLADLEPDELMTNTSEIDEPKLETTTEAQLKADAEDACSG